MRTLLPFLLLSFFFTTTLTSADEIKHRSQPANYHLNYGTSAYQFGELRLPEGPGPYPVAIIIHGGCWVSKFADLENTSALAEEIRNLGVATWNIEYRSEDIKGGGWPGTFRDVGNAADYLRTIAKEYSLDLNHVIVIGHSSGGQLALWLAARHQLSAKSKLYMRDPLKLNGVITLGGVTDLQSFRAQSTKTCDGDVIGKLIGNSPNNYHDASPQQLLPLSVPQILIYGNLDETVPKSYGDAYQRVALQKGDNVRVIEIGGAEHHAYVQPNSVTWPATKASVIKLLHLKKTQ